MAIRTIIAAQFAELLKSGAPLNILDVRRPEEITAKRLAVPFERQQTHLEVNAEQWEARQTQLKTAFTNQSQPLFIICEAGVRAMNAAHKLESYKFGFTDIVVVAGGLAAAPRDMELLRGEDTTPVAPASTPSPFGNGPV